MTCNGLTESQKKDIEKVLGPTYVNAFTGERWEDAARRLVPHLTAVVAARDSAEAQLEILWKETKGIIPSTGFMWLTPRMEREALASLSPRDQA